ncbi:glycosyltransferase family 2 protein [Rhodococcus pyridinivorans]|uniref:glycosyltransferase family 2 protein n=1 Tax=Rhodococcus pyridinivorans TaxID=103816 RepID=UPI001E575801|nr:glycosyltransferase family A protein [Rhodococcus pyridinivorans]UGQ59058.1 glycosyltransferase family 2 protein [Rhodococcus pyridinivorans]
MSDELPINRDLTVVIPAYKAEKTIARAVSSAFAAGAATVIVVDDGSDDATATVAESAGATCLRQENAGAAAARSNGAAHVTTPYLVFLDSDDELVPAGVKNSVEILTTNTDLAVSAGTVIGIADGGVERPFPVRYTPVTTESLIKNGFGPWPPCAAVVRTSSYRDTKTLDVPALSPRFAEDYELLIRLSLVGGIDVRPEPTCRYSLAGGKSVNSATRAIESKEAIRAHYSEYLHLDIEMMPPRHIQMAARIRQARAEWASGNYLSTARHLSAWIAGDPSYAAKKLLTKPWKRN